MDSGDIIYIVFLLVSMLFGIFGKKKKKGQKQKSNFDFDLEELLKKQFNIQNEETVVEDAQFEPIYQPEYIKEEVKPKPITKKKSVIRKPIHKTSKSLEVQTIGDDNELYSENDFDFEPEKAVIYSEILNRPDY